MFSTDLTREQLQVRWVLVGVGWVIGGVGGVGWVGVGLCGLGWVGWVGWVGVDGHLGLCGALCWLGMTRTQYV